jgi:hypothetical protein
VRSRASSGGSCVITTANGAIRMSTRDGLHDGASSARAEAS